MLTALLKAAVGLKARQLKSPWLCEASWTPGHVFGGDGGAAIEMFHPRPEMDPIDPIEFIIPLIQRNTTRDLSRCDRIVRFTKCKLQCAGDDVYLLIRKKVAVCSNVP